MRRGAAAASPPAGQTWESPKPQQSFESSVDLYNWIHLYAVSAVSRVQGQRPRAENQDASPHACRRAAEPCLPVLTAHGRAGAALPGGPLGRPALEQRGVASNHVVVGWGSRTKAGGCLVECERRVHEKSQRQVAWMCGSRQSRPRPKPVLGEWFRRASFCSCKGMRKTWGRCPPQRMLTSCLRHVDRHQTTNMLNGVRVYSAAKSQLRSFALLPNEPRHVVCRTWSKRNSKPQHQPKASTVVFRPVEMTSLQRSGVAENYHRAVFCLEVSFGV